MSQRPEDYQSTLNVGGNKKGGTDAGTNDPFSYLKTKPEHAYLGHFKNPKFLRAGHNVSSVRVPRQPGRRVTTGLLSFEKLSARGARSMLRNTATTAAAKAQIAAERPVAAARVAAREAGITGREKRQMIRTARQSPESARSERRAARRTVATGLRALANRGY